MKSQYSIFILVQDQDYDYALGEWWSSWDTKEDALKELQSLVPRLKTKTFTIIETFSNDT